MSNYIQFLVDTMKIGECLDVEGHLFREEFRFGGIFPMYDTPEQSFLSKQIGAAYGCVTCQHNFICDYYHITKNAEGNKIVYVDPDRECLYTKLPSGEYISKVK